MTNRRILIVEDDRDFAQSLSLRLGSERYETVVGRDAYEATRLARQQRPDLVVMDVRMPAGDGFVVHERLNEMYDGAVPVIYLTGSGNEELLRRPFALGAHTLLRKPVEWNELLDVVHECLSRSTATNQPETGGIA